MKRLQPKQQKIAEGAIGAAKHDEAFKSLHQREQATTKHRRPKYVADLHSSRKLAAQMKGRSHGAAEQDHNDGPWERNLHVRGDREASGSRLLWETSGSTREIPLCFRKLRPILYHSRYSFVQPPSTPDTSP